MDDQEGCLCSCICFGRKGVCSTILFFFFVLREVNVPAPIKCKVKTQDTVYECQTLVAPCCEGCLYSEYEATNSQNSIYHNLGYSVTVLPFVSVSM